MIFSSFIIFMFIAQKTGQSRVNLVSHSRIKKCREGLSKLAITLTLWTIIYLIPLGSGKSSENASFGCCALKDTKKKNMITELFDWFNQVVSINETQNRSKQEFLQTFTTSLYLDSYSSHYRQALCARWRRVALYRIVVPNQKFMNNDVQTQDSFWLWKKILVSYDDTWLRSLKSQIKVFTIQSSSILKCEKLWSIGCT